MGHAKFISVFDAKSGYWQTPVDPSQKWINSFITPEGQFSWNRTPFGLKAAGYTFTKALRQVLQPVKDFTASYIDDTAVYSDTWRLHLKHLENFLTAMECSDFTIIITKVYLFIVPRAMEALENSTRVDLDHSWFYWLAEF
jgi:hypothetical protein